MLTHTCIHMHAFPHVHAHKHDLTHTCTPYPSVCCADCGRRCAEYTHTCTRAHKHAHTHATPCAVLMAAGVAVTTHAHTHTCARVHATMCRADGGRRRGDHARTHTHIHTRSHAYTHMHTHTCTRVHATMWGADGGRRRGDQCNGCHLRRAHHGPCAAAGEDGGHGAHLPVPLWCVPICLSLFGAYCWCC